MSIERMIDPVSREEYLECLRNFRLLDDDFMTKVFEDRRCAELLVQTVLERPDLTVEESIGQYEIKNLQGRSARLDIYAIDSENRVINVEVQRNDKGAGCKRARYHSALLDAHISDPGEQFQNLEETCVIFITEHDVLQGGLPIYHIDRSICELDKAFADEAHIVYVNAQSQDSNTALGRLMHDFMCKDHRDMYYSVLAERVRYYKESEEGATAMCEAVERLCKKAADAATVMTARETRIDIAQSLIIAGKLNGEEIAASTGLTLQEIQELARGVNAAE